MKKKNGFTLIELLAVVAILAILALISIPVVQDYVDKAEVKARDVNARNLLRAADNYYSYVNMEMGTEYPIVLDLPSDELKLSGKQPDSGQIIIYEDGSVFMDATFDGFTYVKDRNETKATTGKIIGSYEDWLVEPNEYPNTIVKYRPYDVIKNQMDNIYTYAMLSYEYVYSEEAISLEEYIDLYKTENFNDYDVKIMNKLPKELTNEINYMINKFNVKISEDEEALEMFNDPNLTHIYNLISTLESDQIFTKSSMYALLVSNNKDLVKDTLTIPSYVRREDGGLEKITTIGATAFRAYVDPIEDEDDAEDSAFENVMEGFANAIMQVLTCSLVPTTDSESVKKIIIPEGIEVIEDYAFGYCAINSVTLPSTIKSIGGASFSANNISKITLPNKLESIGSSSFVGNKLSGELIIPKNVVMIDSQAFSGAINEFNITEENKNTFPLQIIKMAELTNGNQNKLTKVTFQAGSKIETIENEAFIDNSLTTVTIPGSIKSIDFDAFNCTTLTSAHIQRMQGTDLVVDETAFGSIIPTYGN